MHIRFASLDDLELILKIERKVFDFPWSSQLLKQSLIKDRCIVLIDQDIILAYLIWQQIFNEINILNVAVDLKYQNNGYCKKLFAFLKDLSLEHGFNKIFLEVRQSNKVALDIYLKQGFKIIGKRSNYYPTLNGSLESAILMLQDI